MPRYELSARVRSWMVTDVCARRSPETGEAFALTGVSVCQGSTELTVVDHVQGADVTETADRVAHVLRTYAVPEARNGTSFALYALTHATGDARPRRFAGPWPVRVTAKDLEEGELITTTPMPAAVAESGGVWLAFAQYQSGQIRERDATIAARDESTRALVESVVTAVSAIQQCVASIASNAASMVAPLEQALTTERAARISAEETVRKQGELLERAISAADALAKERDERKEEREMLIALGARFLKIDREPDVQ